MTVRRQEIKRSLCAPAELFMNEKKQRDPFLATGLLVMQMARAYGGIFMQIVRIFKPNLTSLRCLQSAPAFAHLLFTSFIMLQRGCTIICNGIKPANPIV